LKRLHVILAGPLDVVSEETQHDDRVGTTLIPRHDGRLAPIESGSGCSRVGVDGGLEAGQIDRWVGIRRIVQHSVVDGVEA